MGSPMTAMVVAMLEKESTPPPSVLRPDIESTPLLPLMVSALPVPVSVSPVPLNEVVIPSALTMLPVFANPVEVERLIALLPPAEEDVMVMVVLLMVVLEPANVLLPVIDTVLAVLNVPVTVTALPKVRVVI